MSSWILRSCIAVHVASVGLLALVLTARQPLATLIQNGQLIVVAFLFLLFVGVGFGARLLRGWSTRLLWEWMFVSTLVLGGWIFSTRALPGRHGIFLGALTVAAPFLFTHSIIRLGVFLVSAAGAGVFLAGYMPPLTIWILWGGLTLYDGWTHAGFMKLAQTLKDLEKRRTLLTHMPIEEEGIVILTSHVVLPTALIVQATTHSLTHALILLAALLVGAWYAMMRPVQGRALTILPWTFVWMVGVEILLEFVKRVT